MAKQGIEAQVSTSVSRTDGRAAVHVTSRTNIGTAGIAVGAVAVVVLALVAAQSRMGPAAWVFFGVFVVGAGVGAVFAIREIRADTNGTLIVDTAGRALERSAGLTMLEGDHFDLSLVDTAGEVPTIS